MDPEEETEIKLLLNYPLMSKSKENESIIYKGFIEVNDEEYKLSIKETSNNKFILSNKKNVEFLDEEFVTTLQITSPDIVTFLDCLKKQISLQCISKTPINYCGIYKQVLNEYSEFSRFYLNLKSCYLAHDLSEINVTMLDESNREHKVNIKVNNDEKNIFEIVEYELPCERKKFKKSSNLKEVYNQFVELVERLQVFFNLMDDFDKNCYILDPVPQQRRYDYRRIWLGETLSLIITVNPFNLGQIPVITFLGPERMVETYRLTINNNLEDWDSTNYVFFEVLKLIGLDMFPKRPLEIQNKDDHLLVKAGDCSICFSHRLDDKLPEIVCKNEFCDNCYHIECLYEWLMSVNARRFFAEIVGSCPNCEKNISCPIQI